MATFHREEGYEPFLSLSKPHTLLGWLYYLSRKWTLRWKFKLIKRLAKKSAEVLDIGCGTGEFLYTIKEFYNTYGIEPDLDAAVYAREQLGLVVYNGFLETVDLPEVKFDIVTLWHSLEHISKPVETIQKIEKILKSDGKVIIALPNVASFDARLYRHHWVALDAPRHLWHFTPQTIELIAKKTGFRVVQKGALPLDLFYNVLMSEQLILKTQRRIWAFICVPIRLILGVFGSLIWGLLNGQYSGMFYILKKHQSDG